MIIFFTLLALAILLVIYLLRPKKEFINNEPNCLLKHDLVNKGLKSDELVTSKTNNEGIVSGQINKNLKPMSKPSGWIPVVDESDKDDVIIDNCDVMVVDDSITVLEFLKIIMKECELSCVECKNGMEALNYLLDTNNKLPKLIITDLDMPIMNGIELINNIKKIKRIAETPIFVVSSNPTEAFPLLENGQIKGIVKKPFDKSDLISQIDYIIDL